MASGNGHVGSLMDERPVNTLSALVANKPGVLARIAQVFARRAYNIESLVVSPAHNGAYSRMTIGASGDPQGLDQIIKGVNKLVDVIHCFDHTFDRAVVQELALVKISCQSGQRTEALQICDHFDCSTEDLTEHSMILKCTGSSEKVDALLGMLEKFGVVEMIRTGKVVMARGGEVT